MANATTKRPSRPNASAETRRPLLATISIEEVLDRLDHVSRSARGWQARCPAHDDANPSLSVWMDERDRVAIHCHAGCTHAAVLDALEIDARPTRSHLRAVYPYTDEAGTLLYEICRFEPKTFRPRRRGGGGEWLWNLGSTRRVLYRLPEIVEAVAHDTPVFIVEGEKDADRLASLGLCATTNALGAGKWRSDYGSALQHADVVVLPDNDDAGTNHAETVARSLHGLASRIRVVRLPGLGPKGDVSDWLDAGGTRKELLALVQRTPPWSSTATEPNASPAIHYRVVDGHICWDRPAKDGTVLVRLCQFDARIVQQVRLDDASGAYAHRYVIHSPQFPNRPAIVDAADFSKLDWVAATWGARAIIEAGREIRGHLVTAIQSLSRESLTDRTIYTHLGWTTVDDQMLFLHCGGAIGAAGPVTTVAVDPDPALSGYTLPVAVDPVAAFRASLRLLDVAPHRVTYPLLAAIFRAPLGVFAPVTTSVFLTGDTGSRKSALSGVVQAHFGAAFASGRHFPANWSSTGNSIEKLAFAAKDCVFTVDDFIPKGTSSDVQRMHKLADQVLRGQGNLAGRQRMQADGRSRAAYYPRGLILASGEELPTGKSLLARLVVLDLELTDVDNAVLSELQALATAGLLAQTMTGFVEWIAGQATRLCGLTARQGAYRAQVTAAHARTPDNIAQLYVGLEEGLAYGVAIGAIAKAERRHHLDAAWQIFGEQVHAQESHTRDEDPVGYFLELLASALSQGLAFIADREGKEPTNPRMFGWREATIGAGENQRDEWRPGTAGAPCVGWVDADHVYLDPHACYAVATHLANRQGRPLGVAQKTLIKRMAERGLLETSKEGRNTTVITIAGSRRSVLHVSATRVLGAEPATSESLTDESEDDFI